MNWRFGLTLLFGTCLFMSCHKKPLNDEQKDTLLSITDNIIDNTSFKIINEQTSELVDVVDLSTPVSSVYKLESPYNDWQYWNGVLNMGMISLYEQSSNKKYADYALNNYSFIFRNLPYFELQYQAGIKKPSLYQFFRLSKLDDCGAMAAGLCEVYKLDPKEEYLEYLERAADFISNKQYRLDDGTFVRPEPRPMTLWADDLYMSVPFLARMGKITSNTAYFDDAILQVVNFTKYLWDTEKELYYHCWYSDNQKNGVAHWGRCNGWVMMAQVELLGQLPEDNPNYDNLIDLLQNQIIGVSRYQDKTGLWHQVLDKQDSYLESSATAMFIYCIAKSVNEGWIPESYKSIAERGWSALQKNVNEDGEVKDICIGTGIMDNLLFYYERPTKLNDIHGLGAVLLAGVEMKKLTEKVNK